MSAREPGTPRCALCSGEMVREQDVRYRDGLTWPLTTSYSLAWGVHAVRRGLAVRPSLSGDPQPL